MHAQNRRFDFSSTKNDFIQNIIIFVNLVETQSQAFLLPEPTWNDKNNKASLKQY